jgi:hypothetical protein
MNLPQPPQYGVTDGTYWPDGPGTIPLPVRFPDDGGTYIILTVASAGAGDSLDSLIFGGVELLAAPVAMTAGDDTQSATDIGDALDPLEFDYVQNAGRIVIRRIDGIGGTGEFSFAYTNGSGTVITAYDTRWVLEESGGASDGTYWLMDAYDPGVNVVDITSFFTLATDGWLYFPQLHTLHQIKSAAIAGGGLQSATLGTHVSIRLYPVPATSAATEYPVKAIPPMIRGVKVSNLTNVQGLLDGAPLIQNSPFDRLYARNPMTYDSTGTEFSIQIPT